jgi:hypothetical protein
MSLENSIIFIGGASKNDRITMERDKLRAQVDSIRRVLRCYRRNRSHLSTERIRSSLGDSQEDDRFIVTTRNQFRVPMKADTAIAEIREVLRR